MTDYTIDHAVIRLPNGTRVRIDPDTYSGVTTDGRSWDGTIGYSDRSKQTIQQAIRELWGES